MTEISKASPGRSSSSVIYYSLAWQPESHCERQWAQSVRSLRQYNRTIPVVLCLYGAGSDEISREADRQSVEIVRLGDFHAALRHPKANVLGLYPIWHKLLSLRHVLQYDRILYVDCDTFWFNDPERLFARYAAADWYARDEVATRRGYPQQYDPNYLDEDKLKDVAESLGAAVFTPFNTGVMLAKRWAAAAIVERETEFLDIGWRLLVGEMLETRSRYTKDDVMAAAVRANAGPNDIKHHIPYPCSNRWLVEQTATWLTLGRIPNVRIDPLEHEVVLQSNGFLQRGPKCVLTHYFSHLEGEFFKHTPQLPETPEFRGGAALGTIEEEAETTGAAARPQVVNDPLVLRLNPALNVQDYAEAFERDGLVQIGNFFEPHIANRLETALRENTFWRLSYRDENREPRYLDGQELAKIDQKSLWDQIIKRASKDSTYVCLSCPIEGTYGHPEQANHPLHKLYKFLNSTAFLNFSRAVTGEEKAEVVDATATWYRPGDFLTTHTDEVRGHLGARRIAYMLGFTRAWRADWGGQVLFHDGAGDISRGLMPAFNALTLFKVPRPHSVAQVALYATEPRFVVGGWLWDNETPTAGSTLDSDR